MKLKSIINQMALVVFVVFAFTFAGCSNDDDNSPNIILEAFGPSPAPRGGQLTFIGKNLDRIATVVLPENIEITDIEIVSKDCIKVTIPQNAEVGYIRLLAPNVELKSKTLLTYSEPISISAISPSPVRAGEILTIEGDYLNLITRVIFADNVEVRSDEFETWERAKIEVVVPVEARTGQITLADDAEIPVELVSEEVVIIVEPTVTSLEPNPLKVGQTLTITGTDFDLVAKVRLPGGTEIEIGDVTDNVIVIEDTPVDMKKGAIVLIAKSGAEISSEELVLVKPSITSVSSVTVKNNTVFSISGEDLDLVSEIAFPKIPVEQEDETRAEFDDSYTVVTEFLTHSETAVTLTLPADAYDGTFILGTASDTKTDGVELTFVKPSVSSISPLSVKANEIVTITGENLDLVTEVKFGAVAGTIETVDDATLTVKVPIGAASGALALSTANGTVVTTTQEITINVTLPVVNTITADWPTKKITVEGSQFSLLRTIYLADEQGEYTIKVTDYGVKSDTKVEFYYVEGAAMGLITPMMETFDGDKGLMPAVYLGGTDPVDDPAYVFYDFDMKGSWWGDYGAVENNPDYSLDGTSYFRINQTIGAGWAGLFWRNSQDNFKTDGVTIEDWVIKMDVNVLGSTTGGFKFRLNGTDGDFWSIIPGQENTGDWYTVTIPLNTFRDGDGLGSNILPNVQNINSDFGMATDGNGGSYNICIDNIRFARK